MSSRRSVLIVEDQAELLELLCEEVESFGFDVHSAENGREALLLFAKGLSPDMVLSDVNMPKMNGIELIQELRAAHFSTPFVFLSAYGDKDHVVDALRMGAEDFLDKPYDRQSLRKTLEEVSKLGRLLKNLEYDFDQALTNEFKNPRIELAFRALRRSLLTPHGSSLKYLLKKRAA